MSDLLDSIRAKYPQYSSVDDNTLALAIGKKYPVYLKDPGFAREFAFAQDPIVPTGSGAPARRGDGAAVIPTIEDREPTVDEVIARQINEGVQGLKSKGQSRQPEAYTVAMRRYGAERLRQVIQTPLWDYLPEEAKRDLDPSIQLRETAARHPEDKSFGAIAGIASGVSDLAKGFTTPVGIATLGLEGAPAAVQRTVGLAFAADMARQTPELARELGTEFGKPEGERDTAKIAELITAGAGQTGLTALMGAHGIAPGAVDRGSELIVDRGVRTGGRVGEVQSPRSKVQSPEVPPPTSQAEAPIAQPEPKGDVKDLPTVPESSKPEEAPVATAKPAQYVPPDLENVQTHANERYSKGNVTPLIKFETGQDPEGKWYYNFQLNAADTGYGVPATGPFNSQAEAMRAGISDARRWRVNVELRRDNSEANLKGLKRIESALAKVQGQIGKKPVEAEIPPPTSQAEVPAAQPGAKGDVKGGGATGQSSEAAKPIAAQNIVQLRDALAKGQPLNGIFASDGNDVYYSPQAWKDPSYAVRHRNTAEPGKWIKVNRGFLGDVSPEEVTAHREVAEMLGYKDVPGYPGEWLDAKDLAPRSAEAVQTARNTVAEQQSKEAKAVQYFQEKGKEWRQEWVEQINKGLHVPNEAAKTFKLEPELKSAGYTKGDYFYTKAAEPQSPEALAATTQIRGTEQASEPGLQEGAEQLGKVSAFGGSAPKAKLQSGGGPPHSKTLARGTTPPGSLNVLQAAGQYLNAPDPLAPGRSMQLIIRAYLGKEYGQIRGLDSAFRTVKRYFDKHPKARGYVYQAGDELAGKMPKGWQVQWAIDSGETKSLTPEEQNFAKAYRAAMDWAIGVVQEVSPNSLRDLYTNYFGRIWKDPEKNENLIRQWINSRPLEGNKSFMRERVLKDWIDGIKMGLEPLSDNPVDMMLYKVGEMVQFAGARLMKQEAKQLGLRKFFYLGEKVPTGWRIDQDPKGEVFGPPVVTIKEAYDEQIRVKTLEMLDALGIKHERMNSLGGKRWGLAYEGMGPKSNVQSPMSGKPGEKIQTRFGGPDIVYWHEFGHIMDYRFPDLRKTLGMTARQIAGKMVQGAGNTTEDLELRALADLRGVPKGYGRKAEEKMANVFHAYLHAPDLFQQTAPTVFANFQRWLAAHPDVKNLMGEIKPSLKLGVGTSELQLAGPTLLGHWAMPDPALKVLENFQGKSLLSNRNVIPGLRAVNGLLTSARLFGFFHGGMVTNDSFYGGLSLILNDALRGRFNVSEAAKNLLMVPRAFKLGGAVRRGIEDPGSVSAANRELGKLALEANLRSHIGTYDMTMGRRWSRALNELRESPSIGAAWETFWRAPFAALAKTMEPVMDHLVPRMKYGMNGLQVMRVLQDMPGVREIAADDLFERSPLFQSSKTRPQAKAQLEADLQRRLQFRDQLAKSADSVEDRIGQVTYDNLFLNKTVKDVSTLGLTAFGWHLTKYRGLFGATADWARAAAAVARGKRPEITFRMTYLPAMVMGHAIIGGILHYALTGKRPQSKLDYLFPESGLYDQYGKPIRLAIADYVKDIMGDINALRFHGVKGELNRQVGRLAPAWNMAAEMYRNKDFWGNQIFSERMPEEPEHEHLLKVLADGVRYVAGSSAPFSARAGGKLQDAGGNKLLSYGAPLVGIVPAPQDATLTPSQALASEIMGAKTSTGGRPPAEAQRAQAIAQIVHDTRTGKITSEGDFKSRERAAGVSSKQQETAIKQRVLWTPYQRQVWLMSVDDAMRVWDLASDQEKLQLVKFRPQSNEGLAEKVAKAVASGRVDKVTGQRYVSLLMPYWQRAIQGEVQGPKSKVQSQQRRPFAAVQ